MKDLKDKVAVITGAASGIGKSIAKLCAKEGMKCVLADIEKNPLLQTECEIKSMGGNVIKVHVDVSTLADVEYMARKTIETFGRTDILFNNAGVGGGSPIWEKKIKDWEWTLGVNLYGVIHGIKTFIPIMLNQDTECLIINTLSGYGLIPEGGIYGVSKHAVLGLSEILANELTRANSKIKIAVLIPGYTKTKISESERNRPDKFKNKSTKTQSEINEELKHKAEYRNKVDQIGIEPDEVAKSLIRGIKDDKFYIVHDPYLKIPVKTRFKRILKALNDQYFDLIRIK